jgi:hypothetical protein
MDFTIKQNSELPILELRPYKGRNFPELLEIIQNATVLFSMIDERNCYKIHDKSGIVNIETKNNIQVNQEDSCREIIDFTIQYKFSKKDTSKAGKFKGEFKIIFEKYGEQKTIIVPLNYKLDIEILPSFTKTTTMVQSNAPQPPQPPPIEIDIYDAILVGLNQYIKINDNEYLKFT